MVRLFPFQMNERLSDWRQIWTSRLMIALCNEYHHRQLINRLFCHKEGNVLINDALNTFYLRLNCVKHMVKDHLDSERGNPLQPHGLLFPINSKGSFICTILHTG